MYMRIVRAQPPEGAGEEIGRRWAAFMPERLRKQPGFRHGHFGIDRTTGALAGVTFFDEEPDDAAFATISAEFRESLGASIAPQPPEATVYEIIAEA